MTLLHLSDLTRLLQHTSGMDNPPIIMCNFTLAAMEDLQVEMHDDGLMITQRAL